LTLKACILAEAKTTLWAPWERSQFAFGKSSFLWEEFMMRVLTKFTAVGLLLVALFIAVQAPVSAEATRTDVSGVSDVLEGIIGGEVAVDANGKLHLKKTAFAGGFSLQGDGIDIQGHQVLALTGVLDHTLSGPATGSFVVTGDVGGVETVIWAGSIHGYLEQLSFTGQVVAQGQGPYSGLQLKLQMQEVAATPENPNPEVFDMSGSILSPHGSE
jgi:hypothetical protein